METQTLRLVHLVRQPLETGGTPPMLLLLHGVGSNERDLFELAPYLDGRFLILSVRAPNVRMPGSYAWFEITFTPNGFLIDPAQAEVSRRELLRFIPEAAEAYGADPGRVYLMGFNQGAIMSAAITLTQPELVTGAVLMSGRILPEMRPLFAPPERLRGKPFMVVHGTADRTLPIEYGRVIRDTLSALPVDLTYREYPMGHEVSAQSLADVATWLTGRLDTGENK